MTNASGEPLWLIVGADSRVGGALKERLINEGRRVIATSRRHDSYDHMLLDLEADPGSWRLPQNPSIAFLLAGINSLAACQVDPERAHHVNVVASLALARALAGRGAHIIVISTNLVLAGDRARAPTDAPLRPQNLYASHKAELETALMQEGLPATILRTTKIAESLEPLLLSWKMRLCDAQAISPFSDMRCAPVGVCAIVEALVRLAEQRRPSLHQYGGDRDFAYDEIARMLCARLGRPPELVRPVASRPVAGILAQSGHGTLDNAPTMRALGLQPVDSQEAIEAVIGRMTRNAR